MSDYQNRANGGNGWMRTSESRRAITRSGSGRTRRCLISTKPIPTASSSAITPCSRAWRLSRSSRCGRMSSGGSAAATWSNRAGKRPTNGTWWPATACTAIQQRVPVHHDDGLRWRRAAGRLGNGEFGTLAYDLDDDPDEDGADNRNELIAGTRPDDDGFRVARHSIITGAARHRWITVSTEPERFYTSSLADGFYSNGMPRSAYADLADGIGTWIETNTATASYIFRITKGRRPPWGRPRRACACTGSVCSASKR